MVSRRRTCATVFEIVLPIAFALLMLVIRFLTETTAHDTAATWGAFAVDNAGLTVPSTLQNNVYYSPNATTVNDVMSKVQTALGSNATGKAGTYIFR